MPGRAVFLPSSLRRSYAPPAATVKRPPSSYGISRSWGAGIGKGRNEGMGLFTISQDTFEQLEQFIGDCEMSSAKAQAGIDALVRTMVLVIKGYVQSRAAGPVAPRHRSVPALANRIPVQRISGAYFAGWTQTKIAHAHWMIYNDSKEAWLIEYGIYQRTRRPVLKLSVIDMLRFISTTRTAERFLDGILASNRQPRTGFKLGLTAGDLANRGASNPHIVGPSGALP